MSTSGHQGTVRPFRSRWRALAVLATLLGAVAALVAPAAPAAAQPPAAGQFVPVAPVTVVNAASLAAGRR
jgi:hypothetical protein